MSESAWSPANPERDERPVPRDVQLEQQLRDVAIAVRAAWGRSFLGEKERKVFELLRPFEEESKPWVSP